MAIAADEPVVVTAGLAETRPRRSVYVRGVRSGLGWRVVELLRTLDLAEVTIATGEAPAEPPPTPIDTVIDVGLADYDQLGQHGESATVGAAALIADATTLGVNRIVMMSSAMVYGAIANNPVPLTEAAVLRPDPKFVYARQLASAEALVEAWRAAVPGRRVAVLRPAIPIAADGTSSMARALTAGFGHRFGETEPGAQFVHHDDVASAVAIAIERDLDGAFNVAPDASIPGERVRALSGRRMVIPMPDRVADLVASLRWRFQHGPIPPGLGSYIRHPWTVANDKLRAEGWCPTVTNEQAYVEGTEAKWWTMVTPKRRQEIALAAMVVGVAAIAITAAVTGRRWWRRRSAR